jgi:hypothetical protein
MVDNKFIRPLNKCNVRINIIPFLPILGQIIFNVIKNYIVKRSVIVEIYNLWHIHVLFSVSFLITSEINF